MADYQQFLTSKQIVAGVSGFDANPADLPEAMFDYQRAITRWALRRGKAAIFSRYGTGKTIMQLAYAQQVQRHTGGNVLILAPLAVARQTADEGAKFGISVNVCRSGGAVRPGINVTNYELLHQFDPAAFDGIVLDESSILKHLASKTRTQLFEAFRDTPYRLCCTATPSPNDYVELGGHAEFLGVLKASEMLSTFFTHDGGDTSVWYLGYHAREHFWRWVASWAVMLRTPSDLGYDDTAFELPELRMHELMVSAPAPLQGYLLPVEALTLTERRHARRDSLEWRVEVCRRLIYGESTGDTSVKDKWVIWCNLNAEQDALERAFAGDCVSIRGNTPMEMREAMERSWREGDVSIMITKPSVFGWGMNWQHCHKMAFVGLSDSFEEMDQALHRVYRYGQQHPVDCYVIVSETEGSVVRNIQRKREQNEEMGAELVKYISVFQADAGLWRTGLEYRAGTPIRFPDWLRSEAA